MEPLLFLFVGPTDFTIDPALYPLTDQRTPDGKPLYGFTGDGTPPTTFWQQWQGPHVDASSLAATTAQPDVTGTGSAPEPLPEGSAPLDVVDQAKAAADAPGNPGDTGADPSPTPGVVQQPVVNEGVQGAGDPNVATEQPPTATVSAQEIPADHNVETTIDTCAVSPAMLRAEWNAACTRVFGTNEDGTTAIPAELRQANDAVVTMAGQVATAYAVDTADRVQLVAHYRTPHESERAVLTVTVVVAKPGFSELDAVAQEETA